MCGRYPAAVTNLLADVAELTGLERTPLLVLLAASLVVLLLVLRAARRRARRRRLRRQIRHRTRAGRPSPGEVWFADVPFADGTGSKDRPVLVLGVEGRMCEVARFTSQDRSARRDHVAIPPGIPGLARDSWIDLRPVHLPLGAFRRRTGDAGEALVVWYRSTAGR